MVDCGEKWGISMFMGEYHHSVDEKGRLIIPAKFRENLGEKFIITRGIENCIFVYSEEDFKADIRGLERSIWKQYRTSDEPGERLRLTGTTQNLESIMIPRRSVTTLTSGGINAE